MKDTYKLNKIASSTYFLISRAMQMFLDLDDNLLVEWETKTNEEGERYIIIKKADGNGEENNSNI